MTEDGSQAVSSLLQPLLRAFELLLFVARHLHPPDFADLMASIGAPDADLQLARARTSPWPQGVADIGAALEAASDAALEGFAGLRQALSYDDIGEAYRALRLVPKGLELLYPLANRLAPVNLFFLEPSSRSDRALEQLFLEHRPQQATGVMHFGEKERGGCWLYVPENYAPDRSWPLVVALHGGSGNGRHFLWSWVRAARSRGVIVAAPTSLEGTWALMGRDFDTPNLAQILNYIRPRWSLDASRLLLTGMSDGGTFCYVSGLGAQSPFTHLAPVAAAFHPMLLAMTDPNRLRGLPIHIIHGTLDWMFPCALARQAHRSLARAGAAVTLREIEDLSHTYPRELNVAILNWLQTTPPSPEAAASRA